VLLTQICSILLLSPSNQVLLLHRVKTSRNFAAAYVFPGGNLDAFHDGAFPDLDSPEVHVDSAAYRIAGIRECFEETGILLAKAKGSAAVDGALLSVADAERDSARKRIHGNEVRFSDWVDSVGGVPDTDSLMPFTRWITPKGAPSRRFTTQMYLYMIPDGVSESSTAADAARQQEIIVPTPDGGVEHTAARFDDAANWLARARAGELIIFPPQVFLLHLVSQFCNGPPATGAAPGETRRHYAAQRERLVAFLQRVPTGDGQAAGHSTAGIPWAEKVMSPHNLFFREADDRVVLGLDKPGPELKDSGRGGDFERVVLVSFTGEGPRRVEVKWREVAFREQKEWEERQKQDQARDASKL